MVQQLRDPTVGMELDLKNKDADAAGTGAGILSMIASIGGMIPSLRKGPQTDELKRIQKGGGAGAAMARQTASEAARRVAGNVQGTDLREGLRAADTIVQRGAAQAAITGAQESALATRQLRTNEFIRRGAFKTLGAGVGQGLAGMAGVLAAAKDQGPIQAQAETQLGTPADGVAQEPSAQVGEVAPQGASAQSQATRTLPGAAPGPPGSLPGEAPFPPDLQADPRLGQEQYPGAENKGVQPPTPEQLREQKVMQEVGQLVETTRDKQAAEDLYRYSASTPGDQEISDAVGYSAPNPPGLSDPFLIEEWIYNQAMNYDSRLDHGLAPDMAAELLIKYGFDPDLARLGLVAPEAAQPMSPHGRLEQKAVRGAHDAGMTIRNMLFGGSESQ